MPKKELLFICLLLVMLFLSIIAAVYDGEQWTEFASKHNCKVISKTSSTTSMGIGVNTKGGTSVVPIVTPGKTGYLCDDGITYYR